MLLNINCVTSTETCTENYTYNLRGMETWMRYSKIIGNPYLLRFDLKPDVLNSESVAAFVRNVRHNPLESSRHHRSLHTGMLEFRNAVRACAMCHANPFIPTIKYIYYTSRYTPIRLSSRAHRDQTEMRMSSLISTRCAFCNHSISNSFFRYLAVYQHTRIVRV